MADQEIEPVGRPAGAEHALRSQWPESLERREQQCEQRQVEQKPVEPEIRRCGGHFAGNADVPAAQGARGKRQTHPRKAQHLASAQQGARETEQEGEADQRLDDRAGPRQR